MTCEIDDARQSAWRFFWSWLILASAFSISANVAHAVLLAPGGMVWMTGAAAVVAPCVQIAATHSISLLVRTRANGWTYWSALAMTVVIGVFAFVLSFDAIRSLAMTLGFAGSVLGVPIAAIFPLAIDVSIAHATLCLLSQSPPRPAAATSGPTDGVITETSSSLWQDHGHLPVPAHRAVHVPVDALAFSAPDDGGPRQDSTSGELNEAGGHECFGAQIPCSPRPARPLAAVPSAVVGEDRDDGGAPIRAELSNTELLTLAETLVRNKVTTKQPELVYDLLADRAAGMRPTAIASKHNVHHSVVRKVLKAAELAS